MKINKVDIEVEKYETPYWVSHFWDWIVLKDGIKLKEKNGNLERKK